MVVLTLYIAAFLITFIFLLAGFIFGKKKIILRSLVCGGALLLILLTDKAEIALYILGAFIVEILFEIIYRLYGDKIYKFFFG